MLEERLPPILTLTAVILSSTALPPVKVAPGRGTREVQNPEPWLLQGGCELGQACSSAWASVHSGPPASTLWASEPVPKAGVGLAKGTDIVPWGLQGAVCRACSPLWLAEPPGGSHSLSCSPCPACVAPHVPQLRSSPAAPPALITGSSTKCGHPGIRRGRSPASRPSLGGRGAGLICHPGSPCP